MIEKVFMGVVFSLFSLFMLGGCATDVSHEEYDAVVAERDVAQTQVANLQADLTAAQAKVDTLQTERDAFQTQATTLESDYASLENQYGQLQTTYGQLVQDYKVLESKYTELEQSFTPSPATLPATVTAGNLDIEFKEAHTDDRIGQLGPVGNFIVVTMEVTNISREEEYIFSDDFLLIGSERGIYQAYDFGFNPPEGFLWLGETISGGATIELKIAFDLPIGEHNMYLLITQTWDKQYWTTIALGL